VSRRPDFSQKAKIKAEVLSFAGRMLTTPGLEAGVILVKDMGAPGMGIMNLLGLVC
jgi:hypothetical protein